MQRRVEKGGQAREGEEDKDAEHRQRRPAAPARPAPKTARRGARRQPARRCAGAGGAGGHSREPVRNPLAVQQGVVSVWRGRGPPRSGCHPPALRARGGARCRCCTSSPHRRRRRGRRSGRRPAAAAGRGRGRRCRRSRRPGRPRRPGPAPRHGRSGATGRMPCQASYMAGRTRSFIAASSDDEAPPRPASRAPRAASSSPAGPAIQRPGSSITGRPSPPSVALMAPASAAGVGAGSSR